MTTATLTHDSLRAHTPEGAWTLRFRRRGYQRMLVIRSDINLYYFWEKRWFFIAMAFRAPPDGVPILATEEP